MKCSLTNSVVADLVGEGKKALHNKWVCSSPTYSVLRGPAVIGGGWSAQISLLYRLSCCRVELSLLPRVSQVHALTPTPCRAVRRSGRRLCQPAEVGQLCAGMQPRMKAKSLSSCMLSGDARFWLIRILSIRVENLNRTGPFIYSNYYKSGCALALRHHQCE